MLFKRVCCSKISGTGYSMLERFRPSILLRTLLSHFISRSIWVVRRHHPADGKVNDCCADERRACAAVSHHAQPLETQQSSLSEVGSSGQSAQHGSVVFFPVVCGDPASSAKRIWPPWREREAGQIGETQTATRELDGRIVDRSDGIRFGSRQGFS